MTKKSDSTMFGCAAMVALAGCGSASPPDHTQALVQQFVSSGAPRILGPSGGPARWCQARNFKDALLADDAAGSCSACIGEPVVSAACKRCWGDGSDVADLAIFVVGLNHGDEDPGTATPAGLREAADRIVSLWPDPLKPLIVVISQSTQRGLDDSTGREFFYDLGNAYRGRAPLRLILNEQFGANDREGVILSGLEFVEHSDWAGELGTHTPTSFWKYGSEIVNLPGDQGAYNDYATAEIDLKAKGFEENLGVVAVRYHTNNQYARNHQAFVTYSKTTELRGVRTNMPMLIAGDFNAHLLPSPPPKDALPLAIWPDVEWIRFFADRALAVSRSQPCSDPRSGATFPLFDDIEGFALFDGPARTRFMYPIAFAYDTDSSGKPTTPLKGIKVAGVGHSVIGAAFRVKRPAARGPAPVCDVHAPAIESCIRRCQPSCAQHGKPAAACLSTCTNDCCSPALPPVGSSTVPPPVGSSVPPPPPPPPRCDIHSTSIERCVALCEPECRSHGTSGPACINVCRKQCCGD